MPPSPNHYRWRCTASRGSGVAPGDTVMVFGAGPIGALSVAALQSMGVTDITVVEPHGGRRRLAADLGVSAVVDPADLEVFPSWEPETHVGTRR